MTCDDQQHQKTTFGKPRDVKIKENITKFKRYTSVHLEHNSKVGPLKLNPWSLILKKFKDWGVFLPLIFHDFDNLKWNFAQITYVVLLFWTKASCILLYLL